MHSSAKLGEYAVVVLKMGQHPCSELRHNWLSVAVKTRLGQVTSNFLCPFRARGPEPVSHYVERQNGEHREFRYEESQADGRVKHYRAKLGHELCRIRGRPL